MSLKEQLLNDIQSQFMNGEGILKLVMKIPCEDMNLFIRMREIATNKIDEHHEKDMWEEISKDIKIASNPTSEADLKEHEIYFAICCIQMHYYAIYFEKILPPSNYFRFRFDGQTLRFENLKGTRYNQGNDPFTSWTPNSKYKFYQVLDENKIDEVRKTLQKNDLK